MLHLRRAILNPNPDLGIRTLQIQYLTQNT